MLERLPNVYARPEAVYWNIVSGQGFKFKVFGCRVRNFQVQASAVSSDPESGSQG